MSEIEVFVRCTVTMSVSGVLTLGQLFPPNGEPVFEHEQDRAAEAGAAIAPDPVRDERGAIALGPIRSSEVAK